jgi:hypothetical protein
LLACLLIRTAMVAAMILGRGRRLALLRQRWKRGREHCHAAHKHQSAEHRHRILLSIAS